MLRPRVYGVASTNKTHNAAINDFWPRSRLSRQIGWMPSFVKCSPGLRWGRRLQLAPNWWPTWWWSSSPRYTHKSADFPPCFQKKSGKFEYIVLKIKDDWLWRGYGHHRLAIHINWLTWPPCFLNKWARNLKIVLAESCRKPCPFSGNPVRPIFSTKE